MNYVLSYLTLAVLFIVQTTLGRYIDIGGIAPNIVFVYVLCYCMYNFHVRAAVLSVIAGIMVDLYSGSHVGVNALLYMYIGLAISNFASTLMKKNIWTIALGVILVSVLYHTIILITEYVIAGHSGFIYPFLRIVLPTAVYDGAVSLVLSLWAQWLSKDKIRGL